MRSHLDISDAVMASFTDAPRARRVKTTEPQPAWATTVTPALLPAVAPRSGASTSNTKRAVDVLPSGSTTTETLPPLVLLDLPQVEQAGDLRPLQPIISMDGTVSKPSTPAASVPVPAPVAATGMDADTKAKLLARINAAPKPFDKAALLARLNAERIVVDTTTTEEGGALGSAPELAERSASEVADDKRRASGMFRVALQGASLGTADEIEAAGRALFGGEYETALAAARDSVDRGRGVTGSGVLEFASGVAAPGLGAARFIAGGLGVAAQAARGVAAGAGLGAGQGFASAEDGVANRVKSGAVGAALGGAVGGAAPLVAAGGRTIGAGIGARLGIGDERAARKMLVDALRKESDAAGSNYADAVADAATRTRDGAQPLALGGIEPVNTLARDAAARSPRARRELTELVADTESNAGNAVVNQIDNVVPQPFSRLVDSAQARRRNTGNAAYGDLFEQNVVHDLGRAADTSKPAVADAVATANRWLANEGGLAINDVRAMTPRQLDYVVRALDDAVDSSFRSGAPANANAVARVRDQFRDAAYERVPGYREARELYADVAGGDRALEFGRSYPARDGTKLDDATGALDRMTPEDRDLARVGVLQGLRDATRNQPDSASFLARTANTPARMDALGDALRLRDGELGFGRFPEMESHAQVVASIMGEVRNQAANVNGARQLARGLPADAGAAARLDNIDAMGLALSPKATLARRAYARTIDPLNGRRARLVAELLTGRDGRALDVLRSVDPAVRRAALVEALGVAGANQLTAGAAGVVSVER